MKCTKCNSENVNESSGYRRTGPPKVIPPRLTNKRVSWGYRFDKYTCECGHTWEIKKN